MPGEMRSFHALVIPARSRTFTMAKALNGYWLDNLNLGMY